jgi:hypothetical protein
VILAPLRLLERSRGWRRRLVVLAYLAILIVVAIPLRWLTALNGLPDVGEPRGLAEFRSRVVPEAENAFTFYRKAARQVPRNVRITEEWWQLRRMAKDWSGAGEEVRAWQESCRPALAVWRRGTEMEQAQGRRPEAIADSRLGLGDWAALARLPVLQIAALLEGDRLREEGNLPGAWGWYAAALRASRHILMNSTSDLRGIGEQELSMTADAIGAWLTDPGLDAPLLRRALGDVKAVRGMTPPNSEALLGDYLSMVGAIEDPARGQGDPTLVEHLQDEYPPLRWLIRTWMREPERSRRVSRILFAHWLAAADLPPIRRPRMFETRMRGDRSHPDFPYYVAPGRRDAAHPISSEALYGWYDSCLGWRQLGPLTFWIAAHDADRRAMDALVMAVADRLFVLEQGREPRHNGELVSAGYLESLPEGYDDGPLPGGAEEESRR